MWQLFPLPKWVARKKKRKKDGGWLVRGALSTVNTSPSPRVNTCNHDKMASAQLVIVLSRGSEMRWVSFSRRRPTSTPISPNALPRDRRGGLRKTRWGVANNLVKASFSFVMRSGTDTLPPAYARKWEGWRVRRGEIGERLMDIRRLQRRRVTRPSMRDRHKPRNWSVFPPLLMIVLRGPIVGCQSKIILSEHWSTTRLFQLILL